MQVDLNSQQLLVLIKNSAKTIAEQIERIEYAETHPWYGKLAANEYIDSAQKEVKTLQNLFTALKNIK